VKGEGDEVELRFRYDRVLLVFYFDKVGEKGRVIDSFAFPSLAIKMKKNW